MKIKCTVSILLDQALLYTRVESCQYRVDVVMVIGKGDETNLIVSYHKSTLSATVGVISILLRSG